MAAERPPLDPLTADNTSATLVITGYALLAMSVLITVIRFSVACVRKIKFASDDGFYLAAQLCAIASTVLWYFSTKAGLGQTMAALDPDQISRFFKFIYAAQLAEIAAMLAAKAAFSRLADRVFLADPLRPGILLARRLAWALCAAWAISSIFGLLFQCRLPRPWVFEPEICPTHGRLLYCNIVTNAASDIALAAWIIPITWRLQSSRSSRIFVFILFNLRSIVLVPAIVELIMMRNFIDNSDQTRVTADRAVLNQIIVYISLLGVALPRANQFLSRLHTDRVAITISEFERLGSTKWVGPTPPLRLVPTGYPAVITTHVHSTTNTTTEMDANMHPDSVAVRSDIVLTEYRKEACQVTVH